jgi:formate hydrogenlyase subunit 3/multisubunit Na+/H+ antiporter MnhD subunit
MIAIYCLQNSFAFLFVWELMTLSSFIMVIFENSKPETLKAGLNFLVQSHIDVLFITVGFIWVSFQTNSYDFGAISQYCSSINPAISLILFLCFFVGFAIKAGIVPFHTWLPHAHPVAPSHVSGLMSGVMIKLGIFGILRIMLLINQNYLIIGYIILIFSLFSGLYGVILAIVQHNLKKLLAYHSIENIGIIGIGIGIGSIGIGINNQYIAFAGFAGALLHTLNHSLFKSLLFYSAGTIYQATHTLNIDSMGGLIKKMPHTAILFLIASLAICGLPLFNGFISEFLIYLGLFEGIHTGNLSIITISILSILSLVGIGGLALLCFTKAFGIIFLGESREKPKHEIKEAEPSKLFPQYLIVALIISIGLLPQIFVKILINPISLFTEKINSDLQILNIIGNLQTFSIVAWTFLLSIIALLAIRKFILSKHKIQTEPTWGCGYIKPNIKMQYTASSYVHQFRKLFQPLLKIRKKEGEIKGVFSKQIHSKTTSYDKIETVFIDIPLKILTKIMDKVRFIQNGNIRYYILYGLFFIIIILAVSIVNDVAVYLIKLLKQI